jgi:NodT family efflux transporter outer membrane factor (OMF) lipoprotein
MRWSSILFAGLLCCTSCAPTPRLATIPSLVTRQWNEGEDADVRNALPREDFWHGFEAPPLDRLLSQARMQNPSLQVAKARMDRARAELGILRADRLPTIDANVGLESSHDHQQASPVYTYNGASAGIDVSYDLDLFGAHRAARRAGRDRLDAAGFDTDAIRLLTDAQVARAYVALCLLDERVILANQQLAAAQRLAAVATVRSRAGATDAIAVTVATTNVQDYTERLSTLVEQQRHTRVALAVLVGAEPATFAIALTPVALLHVPALDPGQPAELLVRRPDIRAAEARISAAHGDVDAARRAFLPSIKLSGSLLGSSLGFLGPLGLTSSVGSALIAPNFEGGRMRGQMEAASASQRESVALYRQALLAALGEVGDALIAVQTSRDRADRSDAAVATAERQLRLIAARFAEGDIGPDALIGAQRDHDAAMDAALRTKADRLYAAIDLFRATGGPPVQEQAAERIALP